MQNFQLFYQSEEDSYGRFLKVTVRMLQPNFLSTKLLLEIHKSISAISRKGQ